MLFKVYVKIFESKIKEQEKKGEKIKKEYHGRIKWKARMKGKNKRIRSKKNKKRLKRIKWKDIMKGKNERVKWKGKMKG